MLFITYIPAFPLRSRSPIFTDDGLRWRKTATAAFPAILDEGSPRLSFRIDFRRVQFQRKNVLLRNRFDFHLHFCSRFSTLIVDQRTNHILVP